MAVLAAPVVAPHRPAVAAPAPVPAAALPAAHPVPAAHQLVPIGSASQAYQPPPGFVLTPIGTAPLPAPVYAAPAPAPAAVSPEVARCAAILNHPEAVGREALAKHLALESNLSAMDAVAHLAASVRVPAGPVASAMAGASIARAALGLAPDEAADLAVARGVAAALAGPLPVDAEASQRFAAEMAEGERTARELTGRD